MSTFGCPNCGSMNCHASPTETIVGPLYRDCMDCGTRFHNKQPPISSLACPSGHCPSCGSASLVVSEDSRGVVRALSCISCKLEFPKDWQIYLGSGKVPIPHLPTPASRPSAFIRLTTPGRSELWVRHASILTITKLDGGSQLLLVDKLLDVRETPEQVLSLIASSIQGRSDAPA